MIVGMVLTCYSVYIPKPSKLNNPGVLVIPSHSCGAVPSTNRMFVPSQMLVSTN